MISERLAREKPMLMSVGKAGLWGAFDQSIISGMNILTALALARLLPKEAFGLYVMAFTLISVAMTINQSAVIAPITVFLPRQTEEAQRDSLIVSSGMVQMAVALIGGVFCALLAGAVWLGGNHALALTLMAGSAAVIGVLLREYVRQVLLAQMRVRAMLIPDLLAMSLQLGGLAVLAVCGALTIPLALVNIGVTQSVAATVGWFSFLPRRGGMDVTAVVAHVRTHWRMGGQLAVGSAFVLLGNQAYPWFLAAAGGPEMTALFGACHYLVNMSNPLAHSLSAVLGPSISRAFARDGHSGVAAVARAGSLLLLGSLGLVAVGVTVFADPLMRLFYGAKYAGHHRFTVGVLALGMLASVLAIPIQHALITLGKSRQLLAASMTMLAVSATVGLALTLRWGVHGAAVGLAAATVVFAGLRLGLYFKSMAQERLAP